MVSHSRWKGTVSNYTQQTHYFQPQNTTSEAKSILNNVLNSLVIDSIDIAIDLVNE